MPEDRASRVRAAQQGDAEAYGALAAAAQPAVYALVLSLVFNPEDARDLTQDTLLRGFERIGQLREPARFSSWLMQIARTTAIDWLRSERQVETLDSAEHQLISDEPGPERAAAIAEAHRQVADVVTRLPEEHRTVLYLRFVGGLSYKEMADWLAVPLTTVKWRMHRGLELVKDEVEKIAAG